MHLKNLIGTTSNHNSIDSLKVTAIFLINLSIKFIYFIKIIIQGKNEFWS